MVTIRDRDPYFILPILAALFTFASTYLSSMSQIESNASLKIMNFAMPLMILLMGINIASGLSFILGCIQCIPSSTNVDFE